MKTAKVHAQVAPAVAAWVAQEGATCWYEGDAAQGAHGGG